MFNVIVTRGTYATRGEAARAAATIAKTDAKSIISVTVEPSARVSRGLTPAKRWKLTHPEDL